jgi:hypothetical protein
MRLTLPPAPRQPCAISIQRVVASELPSEKTFFLCCAGESSQAPGAGGESLVGDAARHHTHDAVGLDAGGAAIAPHPALLCTGNRYG